MKILVIRFSSIGDIVFTTPVIRCLQQQIPDAQIHFLCKKSFKEVTLHNPYITKFYYFENSLSDLITQLKKEQYDAVVDLHKNFRTFIIKQQLKVPAYTYQKETWRKFLLTKLGINKMTGRHIVDRNLDTVLPLGVQNDGKGLDYFITQQDEVSAHDLPTSHAFGFVAVVIGASYYTKKLTVTQLQQLCTLIRFPVVLLGGKEDAADGEAIRTVDDIKIYNACGKFTLNQSADLLRKSKLVITHDTGLQYMACAFGKRVLSVWGATSPKLDVAPYYGTHQYHGKPDGFIYYHNFIVSDLRCQPCSNYGTNKCPKGHFKCMLQQDIVAIASKANEWISTS